MTTAAAGALRADDATAVAAPASAVVPFTEEDLHELYTWVDEFPLSRPKRNIARDFADGCCVAEIVKYFFPKLVELHNYSPSMSRAKKLDNWHTLNARVFRKLYFEVPEDEIEDIIGAVPGAIERFLRALRVKIAQIKERRAELSALYRLEDSERRLGGVMNDDNHDDNNAAERKSTATRRVSTNNIARPNTASLPGHGNVHRATSRSVESGKENRTHGNAGTTTQAKPLHPHPYDEHDTASHEAEAMRESVQQLLNEKDRTIMELRETVGILSEKIMKLEELVRVKDDKLSQYRTKFGRV